MERYIPKKQKNNQDLPRWNLDDLYSGPKSKKLKADLAWAGTEAKKFRGAFEGRLKGLDGAGLARRMRRRRPFQGSEPGSSAATRRHQGAPGAV